MKSNKKLYIFWIYILLNGFSTVLYVYKETIFFSYSSIK